MTDRTKQAILLFKAIHEGDTAAIVETAGTSDGTREELADALEQLRISAIEEIRAEIQARGVQAICEELEPLINEPETDSTVNPCASCGTQSGTLHHRGTCYYYKCSNCGAQTIGVSYTCGDPAQIQRAEAETRAQALTYWNRGDLIFI